MDMPLPAAVAAALATGAAFTSVAGSAADYFSLAFTVADHLKAQEGLKFNSHIFSIEDPEKQQSAAPPTSASTRRQPAGRSASTTPAAAKPMQLQQTANSAALLDIRGSGARALFGLDEYLRVAPSGPDTLLYVIHLWLIKGFATSIGDQAEVEFSGTTIEGGYLLTARGFVNELSSGFFNFWCDFLVRRLPAGTPGQTVVPLQKGLQGTGGNIAQSGNGFSVSF